MELTRSVLQIVSKDLWGFKKVVQDVLKGQTAGARRSRGFILHNMLVLSLPCSVFSWPYAAYPLSCTTNLPPHPREGSPDLLRCTLVFRVAPLSHLSCGGSPHYYNHSRKGYKRRRRRRGRGIKQKERQRGTYMYHVCFWICSNCRRKKRRETAGQYNVRLISVWMQRK